MGVDPEDEANLASDEDLRRLLLLRAATRRSAGEETPEDAREQPAIAAAAAVGADLDDLSSRLATVDGVLFTQLEAAVERDVEAALQRLGAQCRTKLRAEGPGAYEAHGLSSSVKNVELPFALGVDGVKSLGIDHRASIAGSLLSLAEWWQGTALVEADAAVRAQLLPLGATLPPLNGEPAHSADRLVHGLVDFLSERLEQRELAEVPVTLLREVVAVAGRG